MDSLLNLKTITLTDYVPIHSELSIIFLLVYTCTLIHSHPAIDIIHTHVNICTYMYVYLFLQETPSKSKTLS